MSTPTGVPVVGFCAYSGSGKTTLATAVIGLLRARGVRVGVVKHAHHEFDVDVPGKDSYELRKAGAVQTVVSSSRRWALVTELDGRAELGLAQLIDRLAVDDLDLVLVEGFKHGPFQKIEILRIGAEAPALYPSDPHVIAVATDAPAPRLGSRTGTGVSLALPVLDLNDPSAVADFVVERILKPASRGIATPRWAARAEAINRGQVPMSQPIVEFDPSCMDEYDPGSLPVEEALRRINSGVAPITGTERVAIRSALGRVLAEPVRTPIDVPTHTNSAMDGYAVAAAALARAVHEPVRLRVVGTSWAGRPLAFEVGSGECARIMTGAVMPAGTDTVVIQERAHAEGDYVHFDRTAAKPGENVRAAGEDLCAGNEVLAGGIRVGPAELGVLASVGIVEITVHRRLRVAFFSTGDELRSLGEPLAPGSVYDSNRYTLYGMLTRLGVEIVDLGVVRDERTAVRHAFRDASACADAVITSGGVSVGEADFVKETLESEGEVGFWKIAMKPGRPLAFGRLGPAVFFGLPGNPVSVMVTFYQFVQPALRRMMGEREIRSPRLRVRCASRLRKRSGRVEFQRGILESDATGEVVVRSTGEQGSGILSSMHAANCFIVLPLQSNGVEEGEMVEVEPFHGVV